MLYLAAKALLSGLIVAAASEIAKRSPAFGALILSLPLLSILAFIWLWRERADTEELAALSQSTFWFTLPTLPMFLVLPALLRNGVGFGGCRPVLPAHGHTLRRDGVGPRPVRCHALEGVLCQRGRRRPTHQSQSVTP